MILGISHIVLTSSGNPLGEMAFLYSKGYSLDFIQDDLPTPPEKFRFMQSQSQSQKIILFRKPNAISVEIIDYNTPLIQIMDTELSSNIECPLDVNCKTSKITDIQIQNYTGLEYSLFNSPNNYEIFQLLNSLFKEEIQNTILIHKTFNLDKSILFWREMIGFDYLCDGQSLEGNTWANLSFKALVRQWNANLIVIETKVKKSRSFLDMSGVRCISVVSTDLERDLNMKMRYNYPRTGIMELFINNKKFFAEIIKGPDDIYIEFLHPCKN